MERKEQRLLGNRAHDAFHKEAHAEHIPVGHLAGVLAGLARLVLDDPFEDVKLARDDFGPSSC